MLSDSEKEFIKEIAEKISKGLFHIGDEIPSPDTLDIRSQILLAGDYIERGLLNVAAAIDRLAEVLSDKL